jgi:ribosome-binding factor A
MSEARSKRVQRVERELFETLSYFLLHEFGHPLPCYASISAVEVNGDLRSAKVFFRLVGGADETGAAKALLEAERTRFQKHVAREIQMKFCPVLRFAFGVKPHLDEVDELLENLHKPKTGFEDY